MSDYTPTPIVAVKGSTFADFGESVPTIRTFESAMTEKPFSDLYALLSAKATSKASQNAFFGRYIKDITLHTIGKAPSDREYENEWKLVSRQPADVN
jgi:hypothetical protein